MFAGVWWIVVALLAYVAQFISLMWLEHRRQAHLVAWLCIVMICPFLGYGAYWLLGRRLVRVRIKHDTECKRSKFKHARKTLLAGEADKMELFVNKHLPYPATHHNRAVVLTNGEATFAAILDAIHAANHYVYLDYYTIRGDGIGKKFLQALTSRAKAGIEVRLLYDGIGSLHLEQYFLDELDRYGIHHACFSPPSESLFKRRLNFRNHRKIAVIDGVIGFLGGINIGDEYLGLDPKLGYWRDSHLKLEGECVGQLERIFAENWHRATNVNVTIHSEKSGHYSSVSANDRVVLIPGKPGIHDQKISETLFVAMSDAKQSIYATTPYFIPDPMIAGSLRIAARSGLDVRLIIPGISDSKLVLLSTLSYIQDMLEAGVKVYRYGKGFIHAKVMIMDGRIASIGSANLDMRSLYSNYEVLALIEGDEPVGQLMDDFMEDVANSEQLDPEQFANRSVKEKAAEMLMHLLSPLL
ncbi:cardiolipin synthase [Paenibacillus sp. strain BS8-2]